MHIHAHTYTTCTYTHTQMHAHTSVTIISKTIARCYCELVWTPDLTTARVWVQTMSELGCMGLASSVNSMQQFTIIKNNFPAMIMHLAE